MGPSLCDLVSIKICNVGLVSKDLHIGVSLLQISCRIIIFDKLYKFHD